jgi:hypothetical protein
MELMLERPVSTYRYFLPTDTKMFLKQLSDVPLRQYSGKEITVRFMPRKPIHPTELLSELQLGLWTGSCCAATNVLLLLPERLGRLCCALRGRAAAP